MGRKSLAKERTQQILDAFEACIVEYGLDGATLQRVADRAEVKLSIIDHYIGKRETLVAAMIERFITNYQQETLNWLQSLPVTNRLEQVLAFYFSDVGVFYRPKDTIILTELLALSDRDEKVKQQLHALYQSFDEMFYDEIRRAVPSADDVSCRRVAYLILSLWVGHATMRWLGFEASRHDWARESADAMLSGLKSAPTTSSG